MTEEQKNMDFITEKEDKTSVEGNLLRGLVDGTFLTGKPFTKQLPFIISLAFLGLFYISNRYHAERIRNSIVRLKNELMELRAEALYTSSELMKMGRQTEVVKAVRKKGLDLNEPLEPPKKIETR